MIKTVITTKEDEGLQKSVAKELEKDTQDKPLEDVIESEALKKKLPQSLQKQSEE